MKFRLTNFGKVQNADIRLDGITVIVGPNGSGKSTISRAMMTWCSVIRRMEDLALIERLKSLRDAVNEILRSNDVPVIRFSMLWERGFSIKFLVPEVWRNEEMVAKLLRRSMDPYQRRYADARRYGEGVAAMVERIIGLYEKIAPVVEQVARKDEREYGKGILEEAFRRAFDEDLASFTSKVESGSIHSESDSGKRRMAEFRDGELLNVEGLWGNHAPHSFYLEPFHLLDLIQSVPRFGRWDLFAENRYQAGDEDWGRLMFHDADMTEWSVERKRRHEELMRALDEILNLIHGQAVNVDQGVKFYDVDVGHEISIQNVASGAKSMAVLARGIKSGIVAPGSLLIIDEPESNLHPAWQISFAKFLVLLHHRFEFKIFINTHSPYFMRAMDVFAQDFGVNPSSRAFYRMVKKDAGYATDDVTNCVNKAFEDMYLPLERLM